MTLTIICPITSRGCSDKISEQPIFHALLPSMEALQMWGGSRLLLGPDDDDPCWRKRSVRKRITRPVQWVPLARSTGLITSIWNVLERVARPWEYLLPANDDLEFETSPLPAIDALAARNGFGIVGFHDHAFPALATFYVVGPLHVKIFGELYPLPWQGAHQDSWIADVYRPWGASQVDERFRVHNRMGSEASPVTNPRFEYGKAPGYRTLVMSGRRKVNDYLKSHPSVADVLPDALLINAPTIIQ